MEFIDLKKQYRLIEKNVNDNIAKVLNHGKYIMGPEVKSLEEKLAEFVGVKHCIAVSSGSDALLLSLMALNISSEDEIITTPFSFFSTAGVIELLGAKPVYVDIDPNTYNIDYNLIEQSITVKTKAIMPVSLYGQCANYSEINKIACKYNIPVIEDGAQSFGAKHNNMNSCALSTIGCTSFFPSKPLGCYGDGGACFTDNDEIAHKLQTLRVHGQTERYKHTWIGINGRLDTLQAAILLAKFEVFPREVEFRQEAASYYSEKLKNLLTIPYIEKGNVSVYGQYTVRSEFREKVTEYLNKNNIPTAVHYPLPIHKQRAITSKTDISDLNLPNAEKMSSQVFSVPMHPYITKDDINKIVGHVEDVLAMV